MSKEEQRKDQELASFTDALLNGGAVDVGERPPLADTVEMLARVLHPQRPPESLRHRLRQRIAAEWERKEPRPRGRLLPTFRLSAGRRIWAGIAALALLAVLALLTTPYTGEAVGTATGGSWSIALIAAVALLVGLLIGWAISRRP